MKSNLLITITALMLLTVLLMPLRAGSQNQANTETAAAKYDVVTGTDENDKIDTGDGNDNISGMGGNDFIESGAGNDLISGGAGDDKIQGGVGDDYIMGNEGNDTISDGPGNDFINLGPGNDTLVYFLNNNKGYTDYAVGGEGEDTLIIVSDDNLDDLMKNQIIKYYEQQNMVGADVGHLGKLNMTLGTSDFEHIMFATGFTF